MKINRLITLIFFLIALSNQSRSTEIKEKYSGKNTPDSDFSKHLNQNITLEKFVLYELYQETKCDYWHETVELPVTCMTAYPIKHEGYYILKFQSGFTSHEKDEFSQFIGLNEEEKVSYIKNESIYLQDDIRNLITNLLKPEMTSLSDKNIENQVSQKFKFEIIFYYGEKNRYATKLTHGLEIEIQKLDTKINAL